MNKISFATFLVSPRSGELGGGMAVWIREDLGGGIAPCIGEDPQGFSLGKVDFDDRPCTFS